VDRDPRDIYTTLINQKKLLGVEISNNDSVHKYIKWHRAGREQVAQDFNDTFMRNRVLRLNFEDFFLHYDETLESIKEFLDIDFIHKDKGTKFQYKNINQHVGIWRDAADQNVMAIIEKELNEYCV
jgi:hypothetical protein